MLIFTAVKFLVTFSFPPEALFLAFSDLLTFFPPPSLLPLLSFYPTFFPLDFRLDSGFLLSVPAAGSTYNDITAITSLLQSLLLPFKSLFLLKFRFKLLSFFFLPCSVTVSFFNHSSEAQHSNHYYFIFFLFYTKILEVPKT